MATSVTRHREGERAENLRPGDFLLIHSFGEFAPRLIGFGQRLHHPRAYSYWTHAALYVGERGPVEKMPTGSRRATEDEILQAEAQLEGSEEHWLIEAKGRHPVRYVPLSQYDPRDYAAVRFSLPTNSRMRVNAVAFTRAQLGSGYGYPTVLTLAVWSVFGGRLTVGLAGANVCSGLVSQATMYEGEIYQGDPVCQMPAVLAAKNDVRA